MLLSGLGGVLKPPRSAGFKAPLRLFLAELIFAFWIPAHDRSYLGSILQRETEL